MTGGTGEEKRSEMMGGGGGVNKDNQLIETTLTLAP